MTEPFDIYDNMSNGYGISQNAAEKEDVLVNSANNDLLYHSGKPNQYHGKWTKTPRPKGQTSKDINFNEVIDRKINFEYSDMVKGNF